KPACPATLGPGMPFLCTPTASMAAAIWRSLLNSFRSLAFRACLAAGLLMTSMSHDAAAQTRIRVVKDQSVIWASGFSIALTVVRAGVELDAVARRGNWYEVVLPPGGEKPGTTGLIAVNAVEVISGPSLPELA